MLNEFDKNLRSVPVPQNDLGERRSLCTHCGQIVFDRESHFLKCGTTFISEQELFLDTDSED